MNEVPFVPFSPVALDDPVPVVLFGLFTAELFESEPEELLFVLLLLLPDELPEPVFAVLFAVLLLLPDELPVVLFVVLFAVLLLLPDELPEELPELPELLLELLDDFVIVKVLDLSEGNV